MSGWHPALLGATALASLLGSLHCAGMCGPLAAWAAGLGGARRVRALALYNTARLVAYVGLGAAAGGLGSLVDLTFGLAGLQRVSAILAGLALVISSVLVILRARGHVLHVPALARAARWSSARGARLGAVGAPLAIGLVTGLLPCGWLWLFLAAAAGTGSSTGGALVLASFWIGTVPAVVGVQALALGCGARWPRIALAVAVAVLGTVMLVERAGLIGSPLGAAGRPGCCHAEGGQ